MLTSRMPLPRESRGTFASRGRRGGLFLVLPTACLPSPFLCSFPPTASCVVPLAFLHRLPQDQHRWELSSSEELQMMGSEHETGRFCRRLRGGEQGTPFTHVCAECRGQIRAPALVSASHTEVPAPVGPLRDLTSRLKEMSFLGTQVRSLVGGQYNFWFLDWVSWVFCLPPISSPDSLGVGGGGGSPLLHESSAHQVSLFLSLPVGLPSAQAS